MKAVLSKLFLTFLLLFIFSLNSAVAASLAVTKIGALDLGGANYKQWWYTGVNPTLYGTAGANSEVIVNVDGTAGTTTADANGNWQFYSDKLSAGEHQITVTSGGETVSFTLATGQSVPEGTTSAVGKGANPVPTTGGGTILAYIGISSLLLLGGTILWNKNKV